MKILYIGNKILKSKSGGDVINERNQSLIIDISKGDLSFVAPIMRTWHDKLYLGINDSVIKDIDINLTTGEFTHVFVSQSQFGRAVRHIALKYPHVKIITFFHNIECDYAKSYLKAIGLKALPLYITTRFWEKLAVKYTHRFITLNKRDSIRLTEVYNKHADMELPTSFTDKFNFNELEKITPSPDNIIDYLFVGVAFFPNIHGIQNFIDKVMPKLKGNLYIVGKGMDRTYFKNLTDRIHILGYVDDIAEYYYRAKIVVLPIFTGAGMKTKTAEALMYGKNVIGTTEAFEGYEIDNRCMRLANSPEEFISAIDDLSKSEQFYNQSARNVFLKNYDISKSKEKIHSIFAK